MFEKVKALIADKLSINENEITMGISIYWWFKCRFIRYSWADKAL